MLAQSKCILSSTVWVSACKFFFAWVVLVDVWLSLTVSEFVTGCVVGAYDVVIRFCIEPLSGSCKACQR